MEGKGELDLNFGGVESCFNQFTNQTLILKTFFSPLICFCIRTSYWGISLKVQQQDPT